MVIQGLIWNCRGLKKRGVATFLKNLIFEYKFHFVGLQETMIGDCEDSLLRKFDVNPVIGKSGGRDSGRSVTGTF